MYKITATYNGTQKVIHGRVDPNARVKGGRLTEQENTIPILSFTIYPNNPGFNMMKERLTDIKVYDRKADKIIFSGWVYSTLNIMTDSGVVYKQVTCEGDLAILCDTFQPPRAYTSQPTPMTTVMDDIITTHNGKVDSSRQVQDNVIGAVPPYEGEYITTFEMVKQVCEVSKSAFWMERVNGGAKRLYVRPRQNLVELSDTEIVLGQNLKSLQQNIEVKDIVTRFTPLGAVNPTTGSRLTINFFSPYATPSYISDPKLESIYGVVEAVKIYDIAPTNWQSNTAISDAINRLYTEGEKDMKKITATLTSFSVKALDLSLINGGYDSLKLFTKYRVRNRLQGINEELELTGRVLELDEPQNPTLTFGQKQTTLTGLLAGK